MCLTTNSANIKRISLYLLVFFGLAFLPRAVSAATFDVGPGQPYATIAGIPALQPGDVVNIHCGTYNEVRQWFDNGTPANPIILQGVCSTGRPVIDGTGKDTSGNGGPRGVWEIQGSNYQVRNLEFRNAHNGNNAAGLRVMNASITVTNCLMDWNDMGLMTSTSSVDNLLVQNSELAYNGTGALDGLSHNVYLTSGTTVTFSYCYIHDAVSGENFKSRAHYVQLLYNYIAYAAESEVEGDDNPDTAVPNSNMTMIGNILVSTPNRTVNTTKFINFGQDEGGSHSGTLYLINNTLIAGAGSIGFLRSSAVDSAIVAVNNIFFGSNTILQPGFTTAVSGSNNWVPATATIPPGFSSSVTGTDPLFVNAAMFDFHLTAASTARNIGAANPAYQDAYGATQAGLPAFQYLSPLGSMARPADTGVDAGGFGFSTTAAGVPDLSIAGQHTGNFTQGLTGVYSIVVSNTGTAPTTGPVTVAETLPAGLTANSITGAGWTCSLSPLSCVRSDALSAGFAYPAITLIVSVASTAPSGLTNTATVSGGGETNTGNDTAADPTTINPASSATGAAAFVKSDTLTRGSWKGVYGADGFNVIDDTASYPSYVAVTPSGNNSYLWASSTSDTRAPQKASSLTDRIAACWSSASSFTINLSFTDSNTHQVALYLLDWDNYFGRTERVEVLDANGNVLDSRDASSFLNGQYLVWNLSGRLALRVTNTNPPSNAVISGIFFGSGPATPSGTVSFLKTDTATSGTWNSAYGADGANVIGDSAKYPSYVTVTPAGNSSWMWASSTTDPRAPQKLSSSTDRISACWYSYTSFTLDLKFNDQNTHQLALYLLDWDGNGGGRSERIDVLDANTNAVLDSRSLSSFANGTYLVWNLGGHVVLRFTSTNPNSNALATALLFGGAPAPSSGPTGTASFLAANTTGAGNWKGVYGGDGFNVIDDTVSYPSYVTVTPTGNSTYLWASSTSDTRALQKASSPTDRVAACWFSASSFAIDLAFNDSATHRLAIYLLDWDNYHGRSERVDVLDANGNLLDTRTVSSFVGGQYLVWNLSGHVVLKITNTNSASNAVVNGLFFGGAPVSTASFVKTDITTQGSWRGVYGADGANVVDDAAGYPSYVTVTPTGNSSWLWTNNSSDARALQKESGLTGRMAACWYSYSPFTINMAFNDANTHQVALYVLDWDSDGGGRSQRIDVLDQNNNVLDSRSISSFQGGQYLVWNLTGQVVFRLTSTNSKSNAIVNGLFFR